MTHRSIQIDWKRIEKNIAKDRAYARERAMERDPPYGWESVNGASVFDGKRWNPVRNLGWLLRNWQGVDSIEVKETSSDISRLWDAWLIAYMHNDKVYVARLASRVVLAKWLIRPTLIGLPIKWFGTMTEINKDGIR